MIQSGQRSVVIYQRILALVITDPEDGKNYTGLLMEGASYTNDGGTYCLSATNQCDTSTISVVVVNVYRGKKQLISKHFNVTLLLGTSSVHEAIFLPKPMISRDHVTRWYN